MKTLSDKIEIEGDGTWGCKDGWCDVEDVKEFIKDLKKGVSDEGRLTHASVGVAGLLDFIDKLAGPKLT